MSDRKATIIGIVIISLFVLIVIFGNIYVLNSSKHKQEVASNDMYKEFAVGHRWQIVDADSVYVHGDDRDYLRTLVLLDTVTNEKTDCFVFYIAQNATTMSCHPQLQSTPTIHIQEPPPKKNKAIPNIVWYPCNGVGVVDCIKASDSIKKGKVK